ncbi:hypothetical protein [Mucilaginibacter antarcticus]|uniref:Uncharacterized protein n=1 Tax=Mucilaginibacter antarcticus TaxID=1855725 RepID=A0ABW5XMP4_9SPHI
MKTLGRCADSFYICIPLNRKERLLFKNAKRKIKIKKVKINFGDLKFTSTFAARSETEYRQETENEKARNYFRNKVW